MHTILRSRESHPSRWIVSLASLAVLLTAVPSLDAAGKSKSDDAPAPQPEVIVPTDPYLGFLDELAQRSGECKSHTDAVKKQLSALDEIVSRYQSAGLEQRKKAIADMQSGLHQLAEVENKLTACFDMVPAKRDGTATWSSAEIPATDLPEHQDTTPTPTVDPDAKQARDGDKKSVAVAPELSLPLPAVPPAPPREAAYIELLKSAAGNSTYGVAFSEDVEHLLAERRQLALRYLEAADEDRPNLGFVIAVVSRRLHSAAEGAITSTAVAMN